LSPFTSCLVAGIAAHLSLEENLLESCSKVCVPACKCDFRFFPGRRRSSLPLNLFPGQVHIADEDGDGANRGQKSTCRVIRDTTAASNVCMQDPLMWSCRAPTTLPRLTLRSQSMLQLHRIRIREEAIFGNRCAKRTETFMQALHSFPSAGCF
jgi:hypothetical protein